MSAASATLMCGRGTLARLSRKREVLQLSIAHIGLAEPQDDGGARRGERVPPHDLLAEQSALGGMMLSKDAVADVIETVRGVDFYVPKHEVVFDAILTLYSHGEPTDVIAVTDELTKAGDLQRAGGVEYLHNLTSMVPTAANAGFYASIVAERALLRRLVEAGTPPSASSRCRAPTHPGRAPRSGSEARAARFRVGSDHCCHEDVELARQGW